MAENRGRFEDQLSSNSSITLMTSIIIYYHVFTNKTKILSLTRNRSLPIYVSGPNLEVSNHLYTTKCFTESDIIRRAFFLSLCCFVQISNGYNFLRHQVRTNIISALLQKNSKVIAGITLKF